MVNDTRETGKLPELTFLFWVLKILATTLGETAGDYLSMTLKLGYQAATLIFFSVFVVALAGQLRVRRYHPFLFWTVIVATSTSGTTMSDYMDRTLELGYVAGTAILLGMVIAILSVWRLTEKTLSVTNIRTRRVELFYWFTILFSNTLGTALGDFLAHSSGLGFAGGAALVGGLLAAVVLAYYFTKISRTGLFWVAFVLTRPFGATLGDVLTKDHEEGGLEWGTGRASILLGGLLIATIIFAMWRDRRKLTPAAG